MKTILLKEIPRMALEREVPPHLLVNDYHYNIFPLFASSTLTELIPVLGHPDRQFYVFMGENR